MHGLLNLNKPTGVTSRDVVDEVQRLVRPDKVGHAGTLDPLATGVLIVCIGQATRFVEYLHQLPKTYAATFLFGRRSDTDDVDGTVEEISDPPRPSFDDIRAALPALVGDIAQRPPDYSAVKVRGQRAYDLARRGKSVELAKRTVTVHSLQAPRYEYPELDLTIHCGSGTYVRSIGRDLAERLGTAAVMSRLVRTAIGPFRVEDALDPQSLVVSFRPSLLLPVAATVAVLPRVSVTPDEAVRLRHGLFLHRPDLDHAPGTELAALDQRGELVAVVSLRDGHQVRPVKVCSQI